MAVTADFDQAGPLPRALGLCYLIQAYGERLRAEDRTVAGPHRHRAGHPHPLSRPHPQARPGDRLSRCGAAEICDFG
jgi:hypothetical protein